jgi:hypothetical protein
MNESLDFACKDRKFLPSGLAGSVAAAAYHEQSAW